MRWLPFTASSFSVTTLILSLQAFLAGVGWRLENAAILTFNTSSFGLSSYHNSSSPHSSNITSLVPPAVENPASITQFLGMKDWYSMHYLRICSGFYAPLPSNPSLLSDTKINTNCTHQMPGYTFSLSSVIRQELDPSVRDLALDVTMKTYNTMPWVLLWILGIVFAVITTLILPQTWSGTERINGYCVLFSLISYITLAITCGLSTGKILGARSSLNPPSNTAASYQSSAALITVPYSSVFLGLEWSSMACMLIVFILVQIEWRFQMWTLKGKRITIYRKPRERSWFLMEDLERRKKVRLQGLGVGDDEGVELR